MNAIIAFERGVWREVRCAGLSPDDFTQALRSAVEWTHEWERALAAA